MKILAPLALAVALGGCAWLTDPTSPERQVIACAAIQSATYRVVDGDESRAERVVAISADVRATLDGAPDTTIEALRDRVEAQIRWDRLAPPDQILVRALLDMVDLRLADSVGDGVLSDDDRIGLAAVLRCVEVGAQLT